MSEGKKAVVTGGSRGIGRAIAVRLARNGYDVAISYANAEEAARAVARKIQDETGRECFVFRADFGDPAAVKPLVREAVSALGGLDLWVNNAAITGNHRELFDLSDDYLQQMLNVNFSSVIIAIREAATWMAKNGVQGSIVNISSVRGQFHCAFPHDAIYGATKAGLDRAIQSFALCAAPYGIRINNIAPGAIRGKTREEALSEGIKAEDYDFRDDFARKKIPLERLGEGSDIAKAVLYLASEDASYVTGVTLPVDGGLTLPSMPERRLAPDEEDRGWGYVKKRDQQKTSCFPTPRPI